MYFEDKFKKNLKEEILHLFDYYLEKAAFSNYLHILRKITPPYKNDVHREGVIFADQDLVIKWTVAKNIFTSYQIFLTIDKTTICSCNLSMVG